ncbi:MAG: YceI family protein [Candidatus Marinimicrobia bacterium]|nr:YceI family protein [Candidatus Neomarinimicrobiota bacterium]
MDKTESSISYTGSHPFHDWQGVTSQIEIETDCQENSIDCHATISLPLISFDSGNNNRDSNMLFTVDGYSFPIVRISFPHVNIFNLLNRKETTHVTGEIDFHGFKIMQEIPLTIQSENESISIRSTFSIQLDSFQVDRPTLLMIPIKNDINIDVNISGRFIQK